MYVQICNACMLQSIHMQVLYLTDTDIIPNKQISINLTPTQQLARLPAVTVTNSPIINMATTATKHRNFKKVKPSQFETKVKDQSFKILCLLHQRHEYYKFLSGTHAQVYNSVNTLRLKVNDLCQAHSVQPTVTRIFNTLNVRPLSHLTYIQSSCVWYADMSDRSTMHDEY